MYRSATEAFALIAKIFWKGIVTKKLILMRRKLAVNFIKCENPKSRLELVKMRTQSQVNRKLRKFKVGNRKVSCPVIHSLLATFYAPE